MIINDLSHIEVATEEETNIQGGRVGIAFANANSGATANGVFFAATRATAFTNTVTGLFFASSSSGASASSTSN